MSTDNIELPPQGSSGTTNAIVECAQVSSDGVAARQVVQLGSLGSNNTATPLDCANGVPTTSPPAVAPSVSANSTGSSLVLKGSATVGGFMYAHADNKTATSGYMTIYNAASAPASGALTAANVLAFCYLPANGWADINRERLPIPGTSGIVVLLSSAADPFTYTTGLITGSIYGVAK